ncbi:MAG TPA: tetratricopeptide repeat protein [Kofleriaceae bacterium]|nr:tetratricopeptide repeat protein [Kofleriaceae bacterium]
MLSARVLVIPLIIATTAPAGAQPARAVSPQADALFHRGREQMKRGKIAEACKAFEQSQNLEPKVTTLLNLAGCFEKLGRLATAQALFLQAERQTQAKSDDTMAQLHKVARDRAAKLQPRVSTLTLRVPDERNLARLEILRDDARVSTELWNRAIPIDGGTYTIVARAIGAEAWSTQVIVAAEADAKIVEVPELQPLPRKPDVSPAMPVRPAIEGGQRGGLGLPISMSVGAAALLGGAFGFSLWSDRTYGEAKAETMDQARRDSLEGSSNRKRYAAEGLVVAGAGCAVVAVWLFIRQRGGQTETAAARTGLRVAPTGSGIGIAGLF